MYSLPGASNCSCRIWSAFCTCKSRPRRTFQFFHTRAWCLTFIPPQIKPSLARSTIYWAAGGAGATKGSWARSDRGGSRSGSRCYADKRRIVEMLKSTRSRFRLNLSLDLGDAFRGERGMIPIAVRIRASCSSARSVCFERV